MVEVGDIIEISDPNWKQKKVSMLGRRYEVKEIPNRRGNFPAVKATPLKFKDDKGPAHPLYKPQADGSTWESSGFTHKGRTRSIPKNTYTVVQSSGTSGDSDATDTSGDSPTPVFGMGGGVPDASPADEPDDLPTVDMSEKSASVSEQVALAAKLFKDIATRSNKHFTPYANDRELDYEKFPNYRIRLDEDNAKGMSVRVIFSAPIDEIDPVATYGTEAEFFKQILNSRKGIVRQYTIGEPVEDVVNRAGNVLPLQWFKNDSKWNEGGKVKGITIDFAPPKTDETPEPAVETTQDASDDSDEEGGFEGLGSLFGAEDMDGLSTYPRISVNLVADDGQEFTLTHTYQGDITLAFPEAEEEVVEETTSATPMFGGLVATSAMVGNPTTPAVSTDTVVWNDVVMIPNYDSQMNRFPSTEKGAGDSAYDIRAVVGIDFNHDHPVFRPYEKPYEIDWDNAPSIMASSATGYVEAVFTVYAPNLPEGSVTDYLPGYFGESNPPYNPDWMQFPRKVSVILPEGDSENLVIPADNSVADELFKCDEIKYYEHKGKYRDIQLVEEKNITTFNPATNMPETKKQILTATWKVGEDYEFETKNIGQAGLQTFKGELTGLIVKPNDSREPAINSAKQSRRERRLDATNEKDSADIFFNKDETNPNTFVVVLKNEKDTPYSGQIIRVKLGGDK